MEKLEKEWQHVGSVSGPIAISHRDLETLAALASARLPDAVAEERRTALLDDVHRAGLDAERILGNFVRHMMSESRGSHTAFDVADEARTCFGALSVYASAIGRARESFGDLLAPRVQDGGAEGRRPAVRARAR